MKIAIIAPSASARFSPERQAQFRSGLENLEKLGHETLLMPHADSSGDGSYASAPLADRLADLAQAYAAPGAELVLAANGGRIATQLLPEIDFEKIAAARLPMMGFSDISALLAAIHARTGIRQYHGPMLVHGFDVADPAAMASFAAAIAGQAQEFPLAQFGEYWNGNSLSGEIIAGNLVSLEALLGTPFAPDWRGKVLFWEETAEELSRLDRTLTHFRNAGVWGQLSGMVVGKLDNIGVAGEDPAAMVREHFKTYSSFPVLKTERFGHGLPSQITIPIGGQVRADQKRVVIA